MTEVERLGRLVFAWGGYYDPENCLGPELDEFIERLGHSSAPEACEVVGDKLREDLNG